MHGKHAVHRQTFTVDEAAQMLGVSRGSAYKAVRDGSIPTIKIGRRALIPRDAFLRLFRDAGASKSTNTSVTDSREVAA